MQPLNRPPIAPALLLLAALAALAPSAQASPLNAAAGTVDAPGADLPSRAFHATEGVTDTVFSVSGAPPELVLEPWEEGGGAVLFGELQGDFNADYEMTFTVVTPHGQDSALCTLRRRDRYVMHTLGLVEGRDSTLISLPNPPYVNTWAAVGFVGPITGNADGAMSLGVVPGIAWLQLATGNVHFVSRREFTYSASGAIDPEVGGGTHWGGGSAYDGPPPEMVPLAMMAATVVQARLSQRQALNRLRAAMDRLGGLWSKFDVVGDSLAVAVARATDLGTLDLIDDKLLAVRGMYGDSFFGNLGVQGLGAWRGIHGLAFGGVKTIAEHPERLVLPVLWAPDVVGGIGQGAYQAGQGIGGVVGGAMSNDQAAIDRGLLQYGEIAGPFLVASGLTVGGKGGAPKTGPAIGESALPKTALTPYYPPNSGFVGTPSAATLIPRTLIDRYGRPTGSFASPAGTPQWQRSLPHSSKNAPLQTYEVITPIEVQVGKVAPWFGQLGGGTQFKLPASVQALIKKGCLRPVGQ